MAYDPSLPANGAPIISAELRNQFAGLKDLIDEKVANADLDGIVVGLSAGPLPPGLTSLGLTVSNPPTQAEVQAIADKVDEVIAHLQRV